MYMRLYALLFPNSFAVRMEVAEGMNKTKSKFVTRIVDYGKVVFATTNAERYAVVLEKPKGVPLSQIMQNRKRPFDERFVVDGVIEQCAEGIEALEEAYSVHGSINLDNVYSRKF